MKERQIKNNEIALCKFQNSIAEALKIYLKEVEDETFFKLDTHLKLYQPTWVGVGISVKLFPDSANTETEGLIIYPSYPTIESEFAHKVENSSLKHYRHQTPSK